MTATDLRPAPGPTLRERIEHYQYRVGFAAALLAIATQGGVALGLLDWIDAAPALALTLAAFLLADRHWRVRYCAVSQSLHPRDPAAEARHFRRYLLCHHRLRQLLPCAAALLAAGLTALSPAVGAPRWLAYALLAITDSGYLLTLRVMSIHHLAHDWCPHCADARAAEAAGDYLRDSSGCVDPFCTHHRSIA